MHRCINVKNFGVDSSMFILIFTYGFFCLYLDYSNILVIPISLVSNRIALYFSLFKTFLYKLNIKILRIVCYCETLHYSWIITLYAIVSKSRVEKRREYIYCFGFFDFIWHVIIKHFLIFNYGSFAFTSIILISKSYLFL